MMLQNKIARRTAFIVLVVVILTTIGIVYRVLDLKKMCDIRDETLPTFPLEGKSQLVEEFQYLDTDTSAIIEYTFHSSSSLQEVADFYDERAICVNNPQNGVLNCEGESEPFGVFSVHIDYENENNNYRIVQSWDRCSSEWNENPNLR